MAKLSKYKICKRLGSPVFEKCQTQKYLLSAERRERNRGGRRGRPRALSDYGRQLIEKQKVRYTYGLGERQLSRYAKESMQGAGVKHNPEDMFICRLESRLDNVIYRAGLANTRALARQIVTHGHITVNGRRVNVPSLSMKEGDTFAIREGSRSKVLFEGLSEKLKEHSTPAWVVFDASAYSGSVKGTPTASKTEIGFDVSVVLEFYSR